VVRYSADTEARPAERLDIAREIGEALQTLQPVKGVASAALFLPELPDSSPAVTAVRKVVLARRLEAALTRLTDMHLIRQQEGEQLWRVTARTSALAGLDFGDFLENVRQLVEPIVTLHGGADRGITADYTGAVPLIDAIQRTLLRDLFVSFLSACGVISLVTMAVERGVLAGLIAMVPNMFPILLLFGLLGWSHAALDIGSVMTASVALGMAVDGTFHFLTFFRHSLRDAPSNGGRPDQIAAVHAAFEHAAGPLVQSSVVCGIGILAFAASPFAPTRHFAWMLSLLVYAALAGDLVVLPALLTTRAGRWFRPSRSA
jgi:predicted RND superfamily exporter protein